MIKRPMKGELIEEVDFDKLIFPKYGSPKIDGFRCVLGQHPMTSRLSRFPNEYFHKELTAVLPRDCFLDSEVVVGKRRGSGVLQHTSSGLTSSAGTPDYKLWVFDRPGLDLNWYGRYLDASRIIDRLGHPRIKLLKHKFLRDKLELMDYITEKLELEYEGVMIRDPDGRYKEGKSTIREQLLLKIKPKETFEARIKGYFEEEENTNEAKRLVTGKINRSSSKAGKKPKGTLGGFIGTVLDSKGKETSVTVRVGGGFTARQRKDFWAIRDELVAAGAIMECEKQKMGEKDKPRHPNFCNLRPRWDMS